MSEKRCDNCANFHRKGTTPRQSECGYEDSVPWGQCRIEQPKPTSDLGNLGVAVARWPLVFADEWCGRHSRKGSADEKPSKPTADAPDTIPFPADKIGPVPPACACADDDKPDVLPFRTYSDDKSHVPPGQACGGRPWPMTTPDRADRDEAAILPFPGILKGAAESRTVFFQKSAVRGPRIEGRSRLALAISFLRRLFRFPRIHTPASVARDIVEGLERGALTLPERRK